MKQVSIHSGKHGTSEQSESMERCPFLSLYYLGCLHNKTVWSGLSTNSCTIFNVKESSCYHMIDTFIDEVFQRLCHLSRNRPAFPSKQNLVDELELLRTRQSQALVDPVLPLPDKEIRPLLACLENLRSISDGRISDAYGL